MTTDRTPHVQYAVTSDDVAVAYGVMGDGPIDLLMIPDWVTQIEMTREEPRVTRLINHITRFARLITLDKRGIGLSDRVSIADMASLELWVEDMVTVLDAAESERAAVLGMGQGAQGALMLAATHPSRVSALSLVNGYAFLGRDEGYPHGLPTRVQQQILSNYPEQWGTGITAPFLAPSVGSDAMLQEWWGRLERHVAPPRTARALQEIAFQLDVRRIAPTISLPTLVIHVRGNRWVRVGHARWLADTIPDARYLELDGDDHWFWADPDTSEAAMNASEEFFTGEIKQRDDDRVLATVLLTDVVGSTQRAAALGDAAWRVTLDRLDDTVRAILERNRGRLVKHTGDGHLATFDGPGRAIRCALAIRDAVRPLDLELRTGLHTGEVEVRGSDVSGIAVHIAARVVAKAGPGEVLVSGAIPPLVAGSGIEFKNRGTHELKGVPGQWQLLEVVT